MTIVGDMIRTFRESKGLSRNEFCKIVGISTSGLAYYEKGGREPSGKILHKIREGFDLPDTFFTSKLGGNEMEIKEGQNRNNDQKLIDLQQEKILAQEQKIEQLKQSTYPVQRSTFANQACHFESTVEVQLIPLKRRVTKIDLKPLSKALGTDVSPYFTIGDWHPFRKHPLEKIIDLSTQKELDNMLDTLPTIYNSLKTLMSQHYIKLPVIYHYKNKKVYTMCHCKINWANPIVIHTKTEFMNGDA